MQKLWEFQSTLTAAVKRDHEVRKAARGHDFLHAVRVAQYAQLIAPDEDTGRLAWIAGLCHNTDRMFGAEETYHVLMRYMGLTSLDAINMARVIEAVRDHAKPNEDRDSLVTMTVKDADRLDNSSPTHPMRAGQFRPDIPVYDPRYLDGPHPKSTFRKPKTLLCDLYHVLEWETWLRLPKARELGKENFDQVRALIASIKARHRELGLDLFPEELSIST